MPIVLAKPMPFYLTTSRTLGLLAFGLIFLSTTLVYVAGLSGDFMFDDFKNIVHNNVILIDSLDPALLWASMQGDIYSGFGRHLSMLSFAVNHALTGLNPGGFKVFNLALHLLNGLLVLELTRTLTRIVQPQASDALAFWVTAAWLLHPINVTAVLYVVQRMVELATFFTLAGLLVYVRLRMSTSPRTWRYGVAWLSVPLLWGLGVMSKESALLAPLFALVLEWFVFRHSEQRSWFDNKRFRITIAALAVLGTVAVGLAVIFGLGPFAGNAYQGRDFTILERAMTQVRVLWFYAQLVFLPALSQYGLFHDDILISRGWFDPWTTAAGTIGWCGVVLLLFKYGRHMPLAATGVALFLVGHLIESTIWPLELVFEHRNYIPALGLILFIGDLGQRLVAKLPLRRHRALLMVASLLPLLLLGYTTAARSYAYGDPIRFSEFEVANHPYSFRAHQVAGVTLLTKKEPELATNVPLRKTIQAHFSQASQYDHDAKGPILMQMQVACIYGDTVNPAWEAELAKRWQYARITATDASSMSMMTTAAMSHALCLDIEAIKQLYIARFNHPLLGDEGRAITLIQLGQVMALEQQNRAEIKAYVLQAVGLSPKNRFKVEGARILLNIGELDAARRMLASKNNIPYSHSEMRWLPILEKELHHALRSQGTSFKNLMDE